MRGGGVYVWTFAQDASEQCHHGLCKPALEIGGRVAGFCTSFAGIGRLYHKFGDLQTRHSVPVGQLLTLAGPAYTEKISY
jgi:hypothetical protein